MELDAVDVLCHLKALGYDNIEPHLLRKFIKDLKKLIKYEKQKSRNNENGNLNNYSESRCLIKEKPVILPNNHKSDVHNKNNNVFERLSRPNSKKTLCSKAVSSKGCQTDLQYKVNKDSKYSQILKRTQMDPVSLHHYYRTQWQTHKMPGETNHDQLRWQVRQMMMHK